VTRPTLLAVPNVSEGRDRTAIDRIAQAFGPGLLDVHSDADHHRSVFTLAGAPGRLSQQVLTGAAEAIRSVDLNRHQGAHPRVGAVDVAPIVFLSDDDQGAAAAEALVTADLLGNELNLPVFLYGVLAGGRTRAELRRGGPARLAQRIATGELRPDFGPPELHPTAGAVLVSARPPLIAFNIELAPPATLEHAQAIAAKLRESGPEGLQAVRAIGIWLEDRATAQVSTNVEDYRATPPATLVQAIARHARPVRAELVGLAPRAAFEGFPADLQVANKRYIEDAIAERTDTE
jgi:glutamate formiminotransferase